jgi:hypothetical protein
LRCGRKGRQTNLFYKRIKFVLAKEIYINANGTLEDSGRLYNSSVHYCYSNIKHDQFFAYSLYRKLDISHAFNSSSCVMNLPHKGGANLLVSKSEGSLYNILR